MPKRTEYFVVVTWDEEAGCWYTDETNVPGLATGADTFDDMLKKLRVMVPEMLEANGIIGDDDAPAVPYDVLAPQESEPLSR